MTTQDKETIMHETIARASLVAFAEFIGQPINDLDATFQQARALYGNVGSIACVVKIPVDKAKPIIASAVDGGPLFDGVALNGDVVEVTYYLGGSTASVFRSCAATIPRYASEAIKILTTERTKQTPPPPAPPKPTLTVDSIRRQVSDLEGKLGSENQPPIFVFNGIETYNSDDDSAAFLGFLTSGAATLFLTFENRASRHVMSAHAPRIHVHTSPTPFLPEFNTTISAPIDPANPAATLTALAERITTENL